MMKRCFFRIAVFLVVLVLNARAQNYDESKVGAYTLPDVLKTGSAKIIDSKQGWEKIRRPEILKLFENTIYGQMPVSYDSIRYSVVKENAAAMNGKAHLKQVVIEVFKTNRSVKINLVVFIPRQAGKPSPVFLLINNRGLENTDPDRTVKSGFWPAEMLIDSGYAIAAFHVSDLAPDVKEKFEMGVLQLYPEQLSENNGMRAIGAWAWGASRVMDYFETDKAINFKAVAVVGHSRGGKASLWAAAQDQRFAMCITNCSGNTGAALARRKVGERIKDINTSFPHWFNSNYKKFNDHEDSLPVDQHMLIALAAPRPLYATRSGLPSGPPAIDQPVIQSQMGYHNREGEHNMTEYDWGQFIQFANYHFTKGRNSAK